MGLAPSRQPFSEAAQHCWLIAKHTANLRPSHTALPGAIHLGNVCSEDDLPASSESRLGIFSGSDVSRRICILFLASSSRFAGKDMTSKIELFLFLTAPVLAAFPCLLEESEALDVAAEDRRLRLALRCLGASDLLLADLLEGRDFRPLLAAPSSSSESSG